MNWDQIEGQWQQVKGHVRSSWGRLTDDDVKNGAGKRDVLIGRIQARYGVLKEEAERQVDAWIAKFAPIGGTACDAKDSNGDAKDSNGKDKQSS